MTANNLLNRFYEVGLGLKEFSFWLGKTVKQVVHRYPRMKILEIGKSTSFSPRATANTSQVPERVAPPSSL